MNGLTASVGPNNGASELIEGTNYLHLIPTVGADGLLDVSFDGAPVKAISMDFRSGRPC